MESTDSRDHDDFTADPVVIETVRAAHRRWLDRQLTEGALVFAAVGSHVRAAVVIAMDINRRSSIAA